MAGKGGFNLTHSEPIDEFVTRYTPDHFLKNALLGFNNNDLREWLNAQGIPTIVGSSKRVYPEKGIKPITVLNNILSPLKKKKIYFEFEHKWFGWGTNNELLFDKNRTVRADFVILSLGGGTYKVTGSDGNWIGHFKNKGIKTHPFLPANCAYKINWAKDFIEKNEGQPLKNISLSCLNKHQKGELIITQFGLEGNAIYALSPEIQSELSTNNKATVFLDLKPGLTAKEIFDKLNTSSLKKTETLKTKLGLTKSQIHLLKSVIKKEDFLDSSLLSKYIKSLPLTVVAAGPLDEAISSTGGLSLEEVNENFELYKLQNTFCIGEMLDWNAPTGGYLLQACFSMGVHVAKHLNNLEI